MEILKPQELRSIEQFFQLKQKTLKKAMTQYLASKYEKIIETQHYVIAIGNIPVALVAHLDTVFVSPPKNIFYDRVKNVMWSPEGLGADDRAGVFSIIQIVKSGYRPTIIFTTDEEVGGIGAEALVKDYPEAITNLKYIIQLDRAGSNDCVFYDCNNPDFDRYVESFGFVTNFGTFSDISVICPRWGIAGVNLSIGYYNEHSISETLYVGQMLKTIDRVKNMLNQIENAKKFDYTPIFPLFSVCAEQEDELLWDPAFGVPKEVWEQWVHPKFRCVKCHKAIDDYEAIPVKCDEKTDFYCEECIAKEKFPICKICGELFYPYDNTDFNTPKCKNCKGDSIN